MVPDKLRIGMVGGGPGASIAGAHRIGMGLDNRFELVAGAFSRDFNKSRETGRTLGIVPDRVYRSYRDMADAEADRPDGIDCVSIVTPHNSHYEIAKAFLERRTNVVCDKPLTLSLEEALELHRLVEEVGAVFGLTHNYSGYAMVRHAARLVRDGTLGKVRLVQVEHAHGKRIAPQQSWRTDPAVADEASVMFDLGTHAHHLLRFVTGLEVTEVSAQMSKIVPNRVIFDNAHVNLRLERGAVGSLWASMAAAGHEHGLRIRVYGETGSLMWQHEDPHHLVLRDADGTAKTLAQGQAGLSNDATRYARAGLGHPEGFFAAFANLYTEVADAILAQKSGEVFDKPALGCPTVRDGAIGVRFVQATKESNAAAGQWTDATLAI